MRATTGASVVFLVCMLAVASLLWRIASADDTNMINIIELLLPFDGKTAFTANANQTFYAGVERADVFGFSWGVTGTPISISTTWKYANAPGDTHAAGTSQNGVTYTSTLNLTTANGLTDLVVPPCSSIEISSTNMGSATVTPTFRLFRR